MGANAELAAGVASMLGVASVSEPERLTHGYSADSYALRAPDGHEVVLRLLAQDDGGREARFQARVASTGYPAAPVLAHGGSDSTFGRAFILMPRLTGRTPLAAAGIRGTPRLFAEIPTLLASLMARLHEEVPVDDLADDGTERHPGVVVCHGDLHGENILVDRGTTTGVLDWELACVARPEFDVARTALILELLPGISAVARRLLAPLARRSARAFVDAYAERRTIDRDALASFDQAHSERLLIVAAGTSRVSRLWQPLVPRLRARVQAATDD